MCIFCQIIRWLLLEETALLVNRDIIYLLMAHHVMFSTSLYVLPCITANDKAENGVVPTEHTELMEKKDHDSSLIKSDVDARSHISGVSSHPSHSSHSHQSQNSTRLMLEKLAFPRRQLQTLGMLGKNSKQES